LFPRRIESVPLDGIDHADEGLSARKSSVGHIDDVNRRVMLVVGELTTARQLKKINGEQLVIIIGGHVASGTVEARGSDFGYDESSQTPNRQCTADLFFHRTSFPFALPRNEATQESIFCINHLQRVRLSSQIGTKPMG